MTVLLGIGKVVSSHRFWLQGIGLYWILTLLDLTHYIGFGLTLVDLDSSGFGLCWILTLLDFDSIRFGLYWIWTSVDLDSSEYGLYCDFSVGYWESSEFYWIWVFLCDYMILLHLTPGVSFPTVNRITAQVSKDLRLNEINNRFSADFVQV